MSRDLKQVTRTVFEPGTYNSRSYRRDEHHIELFLPAPDGPFNVLRFKINQGSGLETVITVNFDGPAEVTP